ncbi:acyl-CoA synthetase (AMP-forming)/AMP-acid ligase II [Crossiella equi]|uniref:Acyl-CoA synthetase (AMP-forming)/AMP-acid ligase II n=1 Tax=Crossiella equi TaxID=130796 RepID=A0ABS5AAD4_9PSEU|nr:AMP-binding protein [Crossiella equi]MBP2473252.1 acyl-CoA synthetase (AMP-forming)/AMP-acid ligase II [Crossiella equi]
MSLPDNLNRWAAGFGDQPALTFLDHHGPRPVAEGEVLTWAELDRRVSAVAAWIQRRACRGQRAAVLAPHGPHYVVAFLAALRAGIIAVPAYPPGHPGQTQRLAQLLADCAPRLLLTTRDQLGAVEAFLDAHGPRRAEVVAVDALPDAIGAECEPAWHTGDDVAYLQYPASWTGQPLAVQVTFRNALDNALTLVESIGALPGQSPSVSWLPLHHAEGLLLGVIAPVAVRARAVLMEPAAFLLRPERWLRALTANPGAVSAAPDFAYGYCASRVGAKEKALLRLDHVRSLFVDGASAQAGTLARFQAAFAECGLRPEAVRCGYGPVGAAALVSVTTAEPRRTAFDRAWLRRGRAVARPEGTPESLTLLSSGAPGRHRVRIVSTANGRTLPDGSVGEVWVSGPLGAGFWGRRKPGERPFGNRLADADGPAHGWLRTGDAGLVEDGELYVLGKLADVLTVGERQHVPQDVEATAAGAHSALRAHQVAVFTVREVDRVRTVLVAERVRECSAAQVVSQVRRAVTARHALGLDTMLLVDTGRLPRTPTGAVCRQSSRERYLAGAFAG